MAATPACPATKKGNFVGPTIFSGVKPGMSIYDQEIFGPVLCLAAADTLDEAIEFINANPNGNGTAIFTQSARQRASSRKRSTWAVGINVPIPCLCPVLVHRFARFQAGRPGPLRQASRDVLHPDQDGDCTLV